MPQRNLAVELLEKLLKGDLAARRRKNLVQARSFAEMLEQTIRRYQNRAIEAAQVIEELIGLAKEMREAHARGEALKLSEDELAFYDALETNDSAVKVLGDETLRGIARELVETVRNEKDESCEQSEPRLILVVGRARRVGTVSVRGDIFLPVPPPRMGRGGGGRRGGARRTDWQWTPSVSSRISR
jgi:ribosomal protein L17